MAPRQAESDGYAEYLHQLAQRDRAEAERREEIARFEEFRLLLALLNAAQEEDELPAMSEPEVAQVEENEGEEEDPDATVEIDATFLEELFSQFLEEVNTPVESTV